MDARGTQLVFFSFHLPSFLLPPPRSSLFFLLLLYSFFPFPPPHQRGDPFFHRVRHYGPPVYPPAPGPRTSDQTTEYKAKRVKRNANRRNVGTWARWSPAPYRGARPAATNFCEPAELSILRKKKGVYPRKNTGWRRVHRDPKGVDATAKG